MFFDENKLRELTIFFLLLLEGDARTSPMPGGLTIHRLSFNLLFNFLSPMTSFWLVFW